MLYLGVCGLASGLIYQIKHDSHFQSLMADVNIAVQLDKFPKWKHNSEHEYPQNELDSQEIVSNYEHISWFKYGGGANSPASLGL